jgi:hypothetical protein
MEKIQIRKRHNDYYEDKYGNGISIMKEENGSGYYFLDTSMDFEGKFQKLKSAVKESFRCHISRNYIIVKSF